MLYNDLYNFLNCQVLFNVNWKLCFVKVCNILLCILITQFDVSGAGYVQGMSDLLSPILFVMENEVDAFWCFVSFMDHMVPSFLNITESFHIISWIFYTCSLQFFYICV